VNTNLPPLLGLDATVNSTKMLKPTSLTQPMMRAPATAVSNYA
jgi:hypothetical protein